MVVVAGRILASRWHERLLTLKSGIWACLPTRRLPSLCAASSTFIQQPHFARPGLHCHSFSSSQAVGKLFVKERRGTCLGGQLKINVMIWMAMSGPLPGPVLARRAALPVLSSLCELCNEIVSEMADAFSKLIVHLLFCIEMFILLKNLSEISFYLH